MSIAGDTLGLIVTTRGTRPGSWWADLAFGLLMKRLLGRRDQLLPADQRPLLVWDGVKFFHATQPAEAMQELHFGDLIWADDLETPLASQGPHDLLGKVATAARFPTQLPRVDSYKHLGAIQSYDGSLSREIKLRVGQAWGAFREGRRQVYKNKLS